MILLIHLLRRPALQQFLTAHGEQQCPGDKPVTKACQCCALNIVRCAEVLGSLKCDCAEQLQLAMDYIQTNELGVIIYLQQEGRGIGLANKIAAYSLQVPPPPPPPRARGLPLCPPGQFRWCLRDHVADGFDLDACLDIAFRTR